ncbi:MAG TPA: SURF1 family protein [Nocardioidaceae bacterium]|nr:SURF1 family protein [Nocardioidaceae bacterium]
MRFLLSRRWIVLAVIVVVLAYACYLLGRWQFHRLAETKAYNARVSANMHAAPAPIDQVMSVHHPLPENREWRRVTATGTYQDADTLSVRYQTRNGRSGVDVVTPLRTPSGAAVLVDRGWQSAPNTAETPKLRPAPGGQVTVVGWTRVNATGDAAVVAHSSTRAVSSATVAPTLDYPLYGGFLDLEHTSPKPAHPLVKAELPSLGNGPHFFYGLQWWFFACLAVFGFGYLAYDERRKRLSGEPDDDPDDEPAEPETSRS